MTQDEIIEIAKQNLFSHMMQEHGITLLGSEITDIVELCKKIIQSQEQPTPSQSVDEREKVVTQREVFEKLYGKEPHEFDAIIDYNISAKIWDNAWQAAKEDQVASKPQPASQDVQDADVPSQNKLDN